jgi:hypothetical protein
VVKIVFFHSFSAFPAHLPRFSLPLRRPEGYAFGGAEEVGE